MTFCYKKFWKRLPTNVRHRFALNRHDVELLEDIFVKDKSQSQISIEMGVSRQAVSQRKKKIFKRIRQAFEDSGYVWDFDNNVLVYPDGNRFRIR